MVRTSKLLVGAVFAGLAGGLVLTVTGNAEPYVPASQLPVTPLQSIMAIFGLFLAGIFAVNYVDKRAWKQAGAPVGLAPDGMSLLSSPDLTGTAAGRPVRAHTYSTGSSGEAGSGRTYTVVEAELTEPVEWTALVGAEDDWGTAEVPDLGSSQAVIVDGFVVWGDVSEAAAADLLTQRARNTLSNLGAPVSIGDTSQAMVGDMRAELADAEGMGAKMAEGMLILAGDEDTGPTTHVKHETQGMCVDADEFQRRLDAVTAVAEAVDRTSAAVN
jgi:hypothetical protein